MCTTRTLLALLAATLTSSVAASPGEKLDNGLGDLPPYSEWRDPWVYAMPAEKIDNGLGKLEPYSEWRDSWVYSMPAEKLDSGLGDLKPYSEWLHPWARAQGPVRISEKPSGVSKHQLR